MSRAKDILKEIEGNHVAWDRKTRELARQLDLTEIVSLEFLKRLGVYRVGVEMKEITAGQILERLVAEIDRKWESRLGRIAAKYSVEADSLLQGDGVDTKSTQYEINVAVATTLRTVADKLERIVVEESFTERVEPRAMPPK